MTKQRIPRHELIAWALYDSGASAYSAIIQTFVFAAYFTRQVAANEEVGTALWGNTIGIAGIFVALAGPVCGAIADQGGHHKRWTFGFTLIAVVTTALLWFVPPGQSHQWYALIMIALGTIGSELAFVFYSSMLPWLTSKKSIGRWSGWGWGIGYVGGVFSLLICLFVFIQPEIDLFHIPKENAEHIRATFPFTAVWYLLWSLPFFLITREVVVSEKTLKQSFRDGMKQLLQSVMRIRRYKNIVKFMIARMIYVDGLATLFAFGGVYAAGTFDMSEKEVLLFGISLNVIAGIGAISFAWIDDWIGGKKLILISLAGLLIPGISILLVTSKTLFWVFGMFIGIFVGPIQAASRSFLARISPPELMTQVFGFYALSGKATSFMGPLIVAWITLATNSQRAGISTIMVFFLVGGLLMATVKEETVPII